jgi:hypothetical protein
MSFCYFQGINTAHIGREIQCKMLLLLLLLDLLQSFLRVRPVQYQMHAIMKKDILKQAMRTVERH